MWLKAGVLTALDEQAHPVLHIHEKNTTLGLVLQQDKFQEEQQGCSQHTVLGGRCKEKSSCSLAKKNHTTVFWQLPFPVGNKRPPQGSVVDGVEYLGSLCHQKSLGSSGNIIKNRLSTAVLVLRLGTDCLIPQCPAGSALSCSHALSQPGSPLHHHGHGLQLFCTHTVWHWLLPAIFHSHFLEILGVFCIHNRW